MTRILMELRCLRSSSHQCRATRSFSNSSRRFSQVSCKDILSASKHLVNYHSKDTERRHSIRSKVIRSKVIHRNHNTHHNQIRTLSTVKLNKQQQHRLLRRVGQLIIQIPMR